MHNQSENKYNKSTKWHCKKSSYVYHTKNHLSNEFMFDFCFLFLLRNWNECSKCLMLCKKIVCNAFICSNIFVHLNMQFLCATIFGVRKSQSVFRKCSHLLHFNHWLVWIEQVHRVWHPSLVAWAITELNDFPFDSFTEHESISSVVLLPFGCNCIPFGIPQATFVECISREIEREREIHQTINIIFEFDIGFKLNKYNSFRQFFDHRFRRFFADFRIVWKYKGIFLVITKD